MHAIHVSPHTVEIAKSVAERSLLTLVGMGSAVGLGALVFAVIGWYLWNFS